MKLEVDLPEAWTRSGQTVRGPGFVLELLPLEPQPTDGHGWMDAATRADLPAEQRLDDIAVDEGASRDGWPMRVVTARVLEGDRALEARVWGFFQLGPYVGAARARGDAGGEWIGEVVEALRSGRPDWRGDDVVSVVDFYR